MSTNNLSDARMMRGMAITEKSVISEKEDGSFAVPSQTSMGLTYEVRLIDSTWVCTCPDFENREIEACKHIYAVRFWIATNSYLQDKPKPKVFADDAVQCDRCGSIRVIKYGKSADKQAYYCHDCKHKFAPSLLKKAKYSPETITLTLDLYFSGLSVRKIARTLNDHYNLNLGATSIYRWIQRYVPMISQYVNTLTPKLSEIWDADELFVKMKNGTTYKGNKGMAFLWNIMDHKTRFLLASKLSEHRDIEGTVTAFNEAIQNAHAQPPLIINTDALRAYREGIAQTFGNTEAPAHIAKCGINKPHANNNRIERMNGTLRERVKVQRGWKTMKTPLAEGQRIQYNFVKPHAALNGQTPAQKAGIDMVENKDKWMELLRKSIRKP